MGIRIGKVTNIYPDEGKVKVVYEDEKNVSLPLPMLTMNQESMMPSVGDRVVTIHMENGRSKGIVLGTYYGSGRRPKAKSGYRKDFGGNAYATCDGNVYELHANSIKLKCSRGEIAIEELIRRLERIEDELGLPHGI